MIPPQRRDKGTLEAQQSGPYFAACSLHIHDMCADIVKVSSHLPTVSRSNTGVRPAPMELYVSE